VLDLPVLPEWTCGRLALHGGTFDCKSTGQIFKIISIFLKTIISNRVFSCVCGTCGLPLRCVTTLHKQKNNKENGLSLLLLAHPVTTLPHPPSPPTRTHPAQQEYETPDRCRA